MYFMIRLRGVDVLSLIYFSIKVIILLSNNFTAFEYLYCNNLRRPERKYNRKQNCFSKKDDFSKNLIRQTVYSFHQKKIAPKRYAFE